MTMQGRRPALLGLALLGLVALQQANEACACLQTEPPLPSSPVDGQVIAVNSPSLGRVDDFTLRLAGGWTITLTVGALENATEFSPSHLTEHMASSSPVRAFFRVVNGEPTAYRLEDALAEPEPSETAAAT